VVLGNDASGFLSATAVQRKEIIENLLGLASFDTYLETVKHLQHQLHDDIQEKHSEFNSYEQTLHIVKQRMENIKAVLQQLQHEHQQLQSEILTAQQHLDTLQNSEAIRQHREALTRAQANIERLLPSVNNAKFLQQYHQLRQQQERDSFQVQQRISTQQSAISQLNVQMEKLDQQIQMSKQSNKFRSGISKTSRVRDWLHKEQFTVQEQTLTSAISDFTALSSSDTGERDIIALQQRLANTHKQLQNATAQLSTYEMDADKLTATHQQQLTALSALHQVSLGELQQRATEMSLKQCEALLNELSASTVDLNKLQSTAPQDTAARDAERTLAELKNSLMLKDNDRQTHKQLFQAEQETLSGIEDQIGGVKLAISILQSKRAFFDFWESAFGRRKQHTLRSYVLDQSLTQLNSILSHILAVLYEDHSHATLLQASSSVYSALLDNSTDGMLDAQLKVIAKYGYGKRSSGERKRIDLALFFSLLHLAQQQSRYRSKYILVDEVFDSLDSAGQTAALKWISTLTSSAVGGLNKCIVITHSQSAARYASGHVHLLTATVTKDGTRYIDEDGSIVGSSESIPLPSEIVVLLD
jgi:DNA repair exonuclease SbcCD ATPase subunit